MEVIPKKYFLRTAKKYKKKHYDLSKVNKGDCQEVCVNNLSR